MHWAKHPIILEINTIPWLNFLTRQFNENITLKNIPEEVMDEFQHYNVIWLMGVWKRSKLSQKVAQEHAALQEEFKGALLDYKKEDVIGSPYAIQKYEGDPRVGGNRGLKSFHTRLKDKKKSLILDFVPNHTALDNAWVNDHPEVYIEGDFPTHLDNPGRFTKVKERIYAYGKDPYFLPWTDTLQLNAFSQEYRDQAIQTLTEIQEYCEGVRCDMAMLLVNSVFEKTWGHFISQKPKTEFWELIIPRIKSINPDFKFIAEVYWDMEWELMQQGFDYCYDKILYDRILYDPARSIRGHLQADWEYSTKLVRFIENHDEKRALTSFGFEESRAAACTTLGLPGARLIHYGQHLGFTKKLPVQLRRWSGDEKINIKIHEYYEELLSIIHDYLTESNLWNVGRVYKENTPGSENPMISYYWNLNRCIIYIIVNFSSNSTHCILDLSTHRQDIKYEISTLLSRNCIDEKLSLINSKIPLKFDPWGIRILKFTY